MTLFMWIALVALLLKCYLWFSSRKYIWADTKWYWLIGAFTVQNASEFFAYDLLSLDIIPGLFITTYYISLLAVLTAMYAFICKLSSKIQKNLLKIIITAWLVLCAMLLFTDTIIYGYDSGTYPISTIKGDYFGVYLLFGLSIIASIIITIIINYKNTSNPLSRVNQAYSIRAFLPFCMVVVYIAVSMLVGFEVNGSGLFPIASTLFMLITIQLRCKDTYLIDMDPRFSLPFTKERLFSKTFAKEFIQCEIGNNKMSTFLENIEGLMLERYLINHPGSNRSLAAKLEWSRPKLDRKLQKYGLKNPDLGKQYTSI